MYSFIGLVRALQVPFTSAIKMCSTSILVELAPTERFEHNVVDLAVNDARHQLVWLYVHTFHEMEETHDRA